MPMCILVRIAAILALILGLSACALAPVEPVQDALVRLNTKAEDFYSLSRYVQAQSQWRRGLELARSHSLEQEEGEFLLGLSKVNESMGQYQQASTLAWQALHNSRSRTDFAFESRARLAVGLAARRMGEYQEARMAYTRMLKLAQQHDDTQLEADALCSLGAVQQALADYPAAFDYYHRSLVLTRTIGDSGREAKCLNNLGGLYRLTGEYHEALEHYEQSLALRKRQGDLSGQSKVLGNICLAYQNLGDFERAESHCRHSLTLARQIGDLGRQANNLNNLGAIEEARRDYKQALSFYKKSLALKQDISDRAGEARSLNNIGRVFLRMQRYQKALKYYDLSLQIKKELHDLSGQSASLQNLAVLYFQLGRYAEALQHFEQTLALQQEIGQPEILWRAYDGLSRVYDRQGKKDIAVFFGKQAVNTIQDMRARIQALEKKLRRSFLEDKIQVYKRLAGLLVDQGRLWEAQQVLAMVKKEEYFDFIRGEGDSPTKTVPLNVGEADWQEAYKLIVNELGALRLEYSKLTRKQRRSDLTEDEKTWLDELKEKLGNIRLAHHHFILELHSDFAASQRLDEFKGDNLHNLENFQITLKKLGQGAVLVHYFTTEDQLKIIVTGPQSSTPPVWRHSDISRQELNNKIEELRNALLNPQRDPLPSAQALHKHLIVPIEDILKEFDARILMVYLDDALRYLPLAALHDGEHYLAESYGIAIYTAAADLGLMESPLPQWHIAGFGVSKPFAEAGFSSLPSVSDELDAIVKEGSDDHRGILPGTTYMDEVFTPARLEYVLSEDCSEDECYQVVHLATHFSFKPGSWEDSFLLIGNQTRLSLEDLQRGNYYFGNLDLLTLSACETALWSDDSRGREIEGLGTLAQHKGARAVMATLWKVADCSTAVFMEQFYRNRQTISSTKVEALQQTQLAFIKGKLTDTTLPECTSRGVVLVSSEDEEGTFEAAPGAPFSHPFYWAPFVIMGNWR